MITVFNYSFKIKLFKSFSKKRSSYKIVIIFLFPSLINAQSHYVSVNSENYKDHIKSLPSFGIYGDNYFITGSSLKDNISSETSDAKFQLGFRQLLTNVELPWDTFLFFTYRQKSFWDIYKESFPFRETNYNPSLGLAKMYLNENGITDAFWLAFEHESNGRDEESSRSWNFISLQYFRPYTNKWLFRFKGWVPIGNLDGNPDITDYRGYFEVGVTHNIF